MAVCLRWPGAFGRAGGAFLFQLCRLATLEVAGCGFSGIRPAETSLQSLPLLIGFSLLVSRAHDVVRPVPRHWYDAVYLSTDNVLDAGDPELTYRLESGPLPTNSSHSRNRTVTVPPVVSGAYFLIVKQ